jgi:phosphoribosyltransferase-like predicted ribonucleoside biosynthesis protein
LRIALDLVENPPDGEPSGRRVTFQSTTRSPVHAVDQPGYPVRRRIDFVSDDAGAAVTRHLYNAGYPDAGGDDAGDHYAGDHYDVIVVIDEGDARPGADGVAAAIAAATGADVVLCGLPA